MELMKRLDTLDERSRMKLLSTVDQQRNELLGVLLTQLGTSPSKNVRAGAIYLIGRNRLSDGVDELARWIDFAPGSDQKIPEPEPLWEKYPAMEALITIGKPSVKPALELLATDADDTRRTLAVKVIRYVEGADAALLRPPESPECRTRRQASGDACRCPSAFGNTRKRNPIVRWAPSPRLFSPRKTRPAGGGRSGPRMRACQC